MQKIIKEPKLSINANSPFQSKQTINSRFEKLATPKSSNVKVKTSKSNERFSPMKVGTPKDRSNKKIPPVFEETKELKTPKEKNKLGSRQKNPEKKMTKE